MNKKRTFVLAMAALVLGAGVVLAIGGILNLPGIQVYVDHGEWRQGTYSTLDITLYGVPTGYDVSDGTYIGWCLEDNLADDPPNGSGVWLMDSTDPGGFFSPCENYEDIPWDRVNYLLNNKAGLPWDVQRALWVVAETDYVGRYAPPTVQAMIDDAVDNGDGFVPMPGQVVAVALCADGLSGRVQPDDAWQDTIIEVLVPPRDFAGCTPGYWKQEHHLDDWVGYGPDEFFGDVFGVFDSRGLTLFEAAAAKGGGENALYRHATAALLSASNPEVYYPFTVDQVIEMVQQAYDPGYPDFEHYKDMLQDANELGCPLDNSRGDDDDDGEKPDKVDRDTGDDDDDEDESDSGKKPKKGRKKPKN
jgi:hypothetical protein